MKKTSRRTFGTQLAGAIAVIPVTGLLAQAQKGEPPHKKDGEGSPIMVGGGGGGTGDGDKDGQKNRCKFDDQFYKDTEPNSGEKKKPFSNRGNGKRIKTFKITTVAGTSDFSSLLSSPADCEIEVSSNGKRDDVTIFSTATEMGLKMDTGAYKHRGAVYENDDLTSWVKYVELFVTGDSKMWVKYKPTDRAQVCVDWEEDSTMDCSI